MNQKEQVFIAESAPQLKIKFIKKDNKKKIAKAKKLFGGS